MLTKKSIGAALVCALALGASGVASATMVTVDGVSWDTASPLDLTINALNLRETSVSGIGQVLHGYGQIGSINGNNNFCSGCDLTFTFTYTVKTIGVQQVVFDDGLINFYVSNPGTYDVTDPTTASLGTSWLTLTGHTGSLIGFATTGTLFGKVNGTVADPTTGSSGQGFLDATSGPAMMYVDSNSQPDGLGGFADFSLNSEFQTFPANGCGTIPTTDLDLLCSYPIEGTASLIGKSVTSVPEPAEIGLLGLGLGVLGFLIRRHRKETDRRE